MTIWVVGDLDSSEGRRVVKDALRHLMVSENLVNLIIRLNNAPLGSDLCMCLRPTLAHQDTDYPPSSTRSSLFPDYALPLRHNCSPWLRSSMRGTISTRIGKPGVNLALYQGAHSTLSPRLAGNSPIRPLLNVFGRGRMCRKS